jgi:hypothetical protein
LSGQYRVPDGSSIDEYSDTLNTVLEDSFVIVSVPPSTIPNRRLTSTANEYGTVDTTNQAVPISAYKTMTKGRSFDRWVKFPNGTQFDALSRGGTFFFPSQFVASFCSSGTDFKPPRPLRCRLSQSSHNSL